MYRPGGGRPLSAVEGLAVGALIHAGIALVGADLDPFQSAILLAVAVVAALLDGAADASVAVIAHAYPSVR